jgi:hypothetical protein
VNLAILAFHSAVERAFVVRQVHRVTARVIARLALAVSTASARKQHHPYIVASVRKNVLQVPNAKTNPDNLRLVAVRHKRAKRIAIAPKASLVRLESVPPDPSPSTAAIKLAVPLVRLAFSPMDFLVCVAIQANAKQMPIVGAPHVGHLV